MASLGGSVAPVNAQGIITYGTAFVDLMEDDGSISVLALDVDGSGDFEPRDVPAAFARYQELGRPANSPTVVQGFRLTVGTTPVFLIETIVL